MSSSARRPAAPPRARATAPRTRPSRWTRCARWATRPTRRAASVRVVAGTDAGGHGHPPNAGELPLLVAAGLTPMQAIQAATGWAAECVGLEREVGTLEKGKQADVVVVAGDALADLKALVDPARIRLVVKDGSIAVRR